MSVTIYSTFQEVVRNYPHRPALKYKRNNKYEVITYSELLEQVDNVANALQQMGVEKGNKIGIFSYNRPEWVITDLATLKLGAVVVPIYHNQPAPYVKYVINDSGIMYLFIENVQCLSSYNQIEHETPTVKKVILFDDVNADQAVDIVSFNQLKKPAPYSFTDTNVHGQALATIVYTSGTTGLPKGVMLTHSNIVTNALTCKNRMQSNPRDVFLSFLPLCHMFERTCGCYVMLYSGGTIAYAENLTTVAADALTIRPTVGIVVPRVLEKIYEKAEQSVRQGSWLVRSLIGLAVKNLNQYTNLKYRKEKIPILLRIKCLFFNNLISAKFQKLCGGRLRQIVTAGAPLDRRLAKTLYIFGFKILE